MFHFITIGVPTAQSLLLCCWHSMKEISLLFGEIVVRKSKPSSVADNLISPEKVTDISNEGTLCLFIFLYHEI